MQSRQKGLKSSIVWSLIERLSSQIVQFIISIIIARLLVPSDYGVIAMTAIFIGISQTFVDCGFTTALIRKQDCTAKDYSTVFWFNLVIGLVCYTLLFFCAPLIADFYKLPLIIPILRTLSITIIFSSLQVVERAILTSKADFKTQTYASLPATILSGLLGLYLAYCDFGVWSLVWQQLVSGLITTILLWTLSGWWPSFLFTFSSLKPLFSFSSKLLISGLIDTIWNNSYALVIGKLFTAKELGLYSRAYTLGYFPSINLSSILQRGLFPILCKLQDDDQKLVELYRKFLKLSMFIVTPLMFGMCALATPLINILLTPKWEAASIFLQILCFYFCFKPIVAINNNIYQVKGRSDLFLKLEVIKKVIVVFFLFSSIPFGVKGMCIASVIGECLCTFCNMKMASKIVPLPLYRQIRDIIPIIIISTLMLVSVFIVTHFVSQDYSKLLIGIPFGGISYLILSKMFRMNELSQLWEITKETIKKTTHSKLNFN